MKLLALITWVIAHYDQIVMLLGELVLACTSLLAALQPLIRIFARLADLTDTDTDNRVVKWISDASDAIAASLDRFSRYLVRPSLGPSTARRPITTKESRAAPGELMGLVTVSVPYSPTIPPIGSKRPPPPPPPPAGATALTDVPASPTIPPKKDLNS